MAYTPTVWVNDSLPALNATNLNKIENQLVELNVVGSVSMFAGSTAPTGWLLCNGAAVSRTTYSDLFDIIGTTYGEGDGTTTFNLPNLKGKVIVGHDSSDEDFDTLGQTGGEKEHTLTQDELPRVDIETNFAQTAGGNGSGLVYGTKTGSSNNYLIKNVNYGGLAHNIMQPYMVMNYIIKY